MLNERHSTEAWRRECTTISLVPVSNDEYNGQHEAAAHHSQHDTNTDNEQYSACH